MKSSIKESSVMSPATAKKETDSKNSKFGLSTFSLKNPSKFSSIQLLVFALVFAAIGGYVLYRSFAATPVVASVEGENMVAPGAASVPTTIGETNVLSGADSGNANLLLAQSTTLSQSATVQSLSFYVTHAAGKLRLGLYDANGPGGGPGKLIVSTPIITTTAGWDTANVTKIVTLSPGTYWLAYLPNNNALGFVRADDSTSNAKFYSYPYSSGLPSTFSTAPRSSPDHWSFYAKLNTSATSSTTQIISDSTASNSKAILLTNTTTISSQFTTTGTATSLTVTAKGVTCGGSSPTMVVKVDNTQVISSSVSATSWTPYTATLNLAAGAHTLTIALANGYVSGSCSRSLYVDVSNFYGPNPPTSNGFSTSVSQNATITLPYTWTFDPGVTTTAGYFWLDGSLLQTVAGPGPYSYTFPVGSLTAGTHTFGHGWDLPDGTHQTPPSAYTLTVAGGSTGSSGSGSSSGSSGSGSGSGSTGTGLSGYNQATNFPTPAFTPSRTIVVTSQSELQSAIDSLQPGDYIDCEGGFSVSGEFTITSQLSGWAEIHLNNTVFTGNSAGSNLPAVWLNNPQYIRLYGGIVSNVGGVGIQLYGGNYVTWWNFVSHDNGNDGVQIDNILSDGSPANENHLDFKGETYNNGLNLAFDPHAEPGSGLHGVYLGGGDNGALISNSRFAFYVHDQPTGAGIEANGLGSGVQIYELAQNLNFDAKIQVGGNGVQFWGPDMSGVTIPWIECDNLQGRCVDGNGLDDSSGLSGSVVQYGVANNTNLNPALGSTESGVSASETWDTRYAMTYQNVSPSP